MRAMQVLSVQFVLANLFCYCVAVIIIHILFFYFLRWPRLAENIMYRFASVRLFVYPCLSRRLARRHSCGRRMRRGQRTFRFDSKLVRHTCCKMLIVLHLRLKLKKMSQTRMRWIIIEMCYYCVDSRLHGDGHTLCRHCWHYNVISVGCRTKRLHTTDVRRRKLCSPAG